MKKLVVCLMVLLVCNVWCMNGQDQAMTRQLELAVTALDGAKSTAEWQLARGRFERLSMVDKENWFPCYYLAYTDITLSFQTTSADEKQKYLDDASACLEKLSQMKVTEKTILSEINTLQGYWYFAQMAINPAVNGPKYAGAITACFAKAIQLNPENPRAIFLNAYFQKSMAAAMQQNYPTFGEEMEQAAALLAGQSRESTMPHWGIFKMK